MKIFKRNINLGRKVPVIDTPDLRDKCVTTGKLADGSVTTNKIADGAITREKIADGAITNLDNVVQQVTDALEDINKSEQQIQQNEVERNNTWTSWFSDVLPTGVRYLWNAFFSTAQTDVSRAITDAQDTADHPTYVGEDNYVYAWNKQTHSYDKTSIYTRGEGFHVSKTFDSVADMEAYTGTDLKEGDFVLIQSNVEDPDNAKLYTYSGTQGVYNFLVDMSGAIGFTGKTPQFIIGTITTVEPNAPASASLTSDGTDSDGNPKYKLNLALPKGAKGTSDFVVVDNHSGAGDDPNKIYIPSADSEKETHDSIMVIPASENNASAKLKGTTNVVRGAKSVAFGDYNTIGDSATESIVAGRMNIVGASKGAAFGNYNHVGALNGFASGIFNKIVRGNSYAEGLGNFVNGQVSHMEGNSVLKITLTGAANATTYNIAETLPSFFIGLPVIYTVSPENNNGVAIFKQAVITAIDAENNTITLNGTLSSSTALENATARVLCATTQLKASHVEGSHNFIILNDALTENPLQDTIINDLFNIEKEDRLQGGHVEGFGNVIAGKYSHAEGVFNLVMNQYAHAEGQQNKVLNQRGHAEGAYNEVNGNAAHVEGFINIAEGNASHAEGYNNYSYGLCSHAEGKRTVSVGKASHTEGENGRAYGDFSHTEGYGNTAFGKASHAGGDGSLIVELTGAAKATTYNVNITPKAEWVGRLIKNTVDDDIVNYILITEIDTTNNTITVNETLDGTNALSSSQYCIALGGAIADYSFTHGKGVQAGTEAGAVFGKFNVPRNNALFAIGNGTSYTDQHDAFYVDVDGNVYIAGNIVNAQMTQLTNKITELENRIATLEGNS